MWHCAGGWFAEIKITIASCAKLNTAATMRTKFVAFYSSHSKRSCQLLRSVVGSGRRTCKFCTQSVSFCEIVSQGSLR